jgi:predicted Zn-dependent peptidase
MAFAGHPLAFKIAGTAATVRRLSEGDVRAHLRRFYTGTNLVLAVAGPVRPSLVRSLAEELGGLEAYLQERRRQSDWLVAHLALH